MRETNYRRAEVFRQRRRGEFESDGKRIRTDSDTIERVGVGLSKRSRNVRTIGGNREVARIVTDRVELVGDVENEKREFAREEVGITKTAFEIRLGGRFVGVGARE